MCSVVCQIVLFGTLQVLAILREQVKISPSELPFLFLINERGLP